MFLHRLPVEAEPAFAAALDVGVGIEFGVRGGTDFGDFFPVGFAGEQKQFGVGVVAGQMAQLFEEIRQKRPLRIVWGAIGVAARDGVVQFARFAFARRE